MKIFKIAIICVSMLTIFSTMAFASTSATTSGGAVVTITDSASAPPDLSFSPSPTTIMAWNTTGTSYAISGMSAKTDVTNGRMYGAVASSSAIYEHAVATVGTLTAPSSATSLGTGWADKAGITAP